MDKTRLILVLLMMYFPSGCVSIVSMDDFAFREGRFSMPFEVSLESKEETLTKMGIIYVGMPQEDLARAGYTQHLCRGVLQEGNESWITFIDLTAPESLSTITVHIDNGRVKDFTKNGAAKILDND